MISIEYLSSTLVQHFTLYPMGFGMVFGVALYIVYVVNPTPFLNQGNYMWLLQLSFHVFHILMDHVMIYAIYGDLL